MTVASEQTSSFPSSPGRGTTPEFTSIEERIQASADDFTACVWPAVASAFGAGALHATEGKNDPVAKQLDWLGIDYRFAPAGHPAYGISQRIGRTPYSTVTFAAQQLSRLRKVWGRPGSLVPAVHVQAYVEPGPGRTTVLRSAAVVHMGKLLTYAAQYEGTIHMNQLRGQAFHAWEFTDLYLAGVLELLLPMPSLCDPFGVGD